MIRTRNSHCSLFATNENIWYSGVVNLFSNHIHMFTIRHIRTMLTTSLGLTKSGVKWMAEAPAASSPVDDLKDQLKNASNPQELQKLHKQVMKLAQENNTNRAAITKMFEDL